MKYLKKTYLYLSFLPLRCIQKCVIYKKKISIFLLEVAFFCQRNCYSLLVSKGFLLCSLLFVWRVNSRYVKNTPIFMGFFNLSLQTATGLELLVFCFLPSICVFLWIYKKPKDFFVTLFYKIKKVYSPFVLLAKLELCHCENFLSGVLFYFFTVILYTASFKILSTSNGYLFLLVIKYILLLYTAFRFCFYSKYNFLMKTIFVEFHTVYEQLQRKDVTRNRMIFLQLYFLFFFSYNVYYKSAFLSPL